MMIDACVFTAALVRTPPASCVNGLRTEDIGNPDPAVFREQHASYVRALEATGVTVTILRAEEDWPDSMFVEDPVLCLPEGAILMRPGAASRQGEVSIIEPCIRSIYGERVHAIPDDAHVEGGDILLTDREILIGLSARTNAAGVTAVTALVTPWGYNVRPVETPPDILHFKTDCAWLGDNHVLCTRRLAQTGVFDGYDIVPVPDGEEAAANAIRVNDTIFVAGGYPETKKILEALGRPVVPVPVTEAAKLDGGLSCMSLRLR